jgi:hypothetical protein
MRDGPLSLHATFCKTVTDLHGGCGGCVGGDEVGHVVAVVLQIQVYKKERERVRTAEGGREGQKGQGIDIAERPLPTPHKGYVYNRCNI